MGVYIKGMKMLDECYCCPCSQPVAGGLQGRCNLLWREFSGDPHSKYPDCPLVEVKEPNGRLVDADAIITQMNEMQVYGETFTTAVNYVKIINAGAPIVIERED